MAKPIFTMNDVKAVICIEDHSEAKQLAHDIVDRSSAYHMTKKNTKMAIDFTKSSADLAQKMTNHILSYPHEGLKTIR